MNQEIKKLWVEDLRANVALQGKGTLCSIDSDGNRRYCCLGRLCELAIQHGVAVRAEDYTLPVGHDRHTLYDDKLGVPPKSVLTWAGFESDQELMFMIDGAKEYVSLYNDYGHDFNQIADLIEAHL
jgi:hypothetical protein